MYCTKSVSGARNWLGQWWSSTSICSRASLYLYNTQKWSKEDHWEYFAVLLKVYVAYWPDCCLTNALIKCSGIRGETMRKHLVSIIDHFQAYFDCFCSHKCAYEHKSSLLCCMHRTEAASSSDSKIGFNISLIKRNYSLSARTCIRFHAAGGTSCLHRATS